MAAGMHELHSNKQVHRDVKPDNVLVNRDSQVKLADFGLLKDLENNADEQCNTFLGTMLYLSPERVTSQDYGYPSDIWSMGVTLIFCATGSVPLPPDDYWGLVQSITTWNADQLFPESLISTTNNISEGFRDFVLECLVVREACSGTHDHVFVRTYYHLPDHLLQPPCSLAIHKQLDTRDI